MALNRMSDLVSSAGEALGLTADPLYTTLAAKVGQTAWVALPHGYLQQFLNT